MIRMAVVMPRGGKDLLEEAKGRTLKICFGADRISCDQ
jgi:hypothetical protein